MNRRRSFIDKEPCDKCGCMTDTLTAVDDGVFVCDDCLDSDYIQCSRCGEWYEICGYDLIQYDDQDNPVCWNCADEEEEEDDE